MRIGESRKSVIAIAAFSGDDGFRLIQRATNLALTVRATAKADSDEKSEDNIVRLATPSDDAMQVWEFVAMRDYQGK